MEVECGKQTLTINKLVGTKTKTMMVEGDMIVPDVKPDILNTIDSVGNICVYKKEMLEGKVKIDGGINVYMIYLADGEEDTTRGLNTTLDFTQMMEVEGCTSEMNAINHMQIKNIECKVLNGRKINIKVEVETQLQVYSNETIEILQEINNVPNVQTLNSNVSMNTLVGCGSTKTSAKDTVAYDEADSLAEILKAQVSICNQESKISYNKVLLKADVNTKIMYLTEEGDIKIINSSIPVMGFVDMPDVAEDNLINSNYEVRNMIIKPTSGEGHTISIEIEVEISCRAYGNTSVDLIQDMYSTEEDIHFTMKTIETERNKRNITELCNIEEKIVIPEIGNNQIYDVGITPIINNVNVLNKRMVYEGELCLDFIFASNTTTGLNTKRYVVPFNFEVADDEIHPDKKMNTQIECVSDDFIIQSDGAIDCRVNLAFHVAMSDTTQINVIDEIKIEQNRDREDYSMIIYVVKPGDTLWNIAKRYRTTVECIMEMNELEEDKIMPGEKLYIPRYRNNQIEVSA